MAARTNPRRWSCAVLATRFDLKLLLAGRDSNPEPRSESLKSSTVRHVLRLEGLDSDSRLHVTSRRPMLAHSRQRIVPQAALALSWSSRSAANCDYLNEA